MIIDRKHTGWGIATGIATLVATALYLANNYPAVLEEWHVPLHLPEQIFGHSPPLPGDIGSTPLGLIFGTISLLIFLFAALLGARRNHPTWPGGQIKVWLRAHVWLTIFTVPLVLFHCGFHGGGPMTQALLWLYGLVMVSGFWGLFLQNFIPKLMREQLREEVIFEQIPFVRSQLLEKAKDLRDDFEKEKEELETTDEHGGGGTVTQVAGNATARSIAIHFIDHEALPYLESKASRGSALRDRITSDKQFSLLMLQTPKFMHPPIQQVQGLCDDKRRLDLQLRFHYWLHGWLIFHAPTSLVLIVLTILHAIVAGFLYD